MFNSFLPSTVAWAGALLRYRPSKIYRGAFSLKGATIAGFTLAEVLVALMVSAIFTSLTMQALVTAAAFRSKAAQYDEAVSWIQEDLEAVVSQAQQYESSALPFSLLCNATTEADGMAARFISDSTNGLGGPTATIGPRVLGGKSYTLNRTAQFDTTSDPFRLIEMIYTVTPDAGGPAVATVRTEVIPYAVLRCP
jgi:prepilin-type N-terminal cleavage/methylation domain-containing protein